LSPTTCARSGWRSGTGSDISIRPALCCVRETNPPGWRVADLATVAELSGKSEQELTESYRRHGDAGSVAAEVLPDVQRAVLSLATVSQVFDQIAAARGAAAKGHLLRELLQRATPLEAKYIVKIISGDLRIGLKKVSWRKLLLRLSTRRSTR